MTEAILINVITHSFYTPDSGHILPYILDCSLQGWSERKVPLSQVFL